MLLIGVNRSPYTRRVAITLTAYGVVYQQKSVSGFGNREEVRLANPLGRIPARGTWPHTWPRRLCDCRERPNLRAVEGYTPCGSPDNSLV